MKRGSAETPSRPARSTVKHVDYRYTNKNDVDYSLMKAKSRQSKTLTVLDTPRSKVARQFEEMTIKDKKPKPRRLLPSRYEECEENMEVENDENESPKISPKKKVRVRTEKIELVKEDDAVRMETRSSSTSRSSSRAEQEQSNDTIKKHKALEENQKLKSSRKSARIEGFNPCDDNMDIQHIRIRLKKIPFEEEYRVSNTPVNLNKKINKAHSQSDTHSSSDDDSDYSDTDSDQEGSPNKRTKMIRNINMRKKEPRKALTNKPPHRKTETLEDLKNRLHVSEVPEKMPCREEQYSCVERFLKNAVMSGGKSGSMYISGVPGTGKTATVQMVVNAMKNKPKEFPLFDFVIVNAMELATPHDIYVVLYKQLIGDKRISAKAARIKLTSYLSMCNKNRPPIVILVDELDQLLTKSSDVVYQVFDWTTVEDSRVSVIAISNTLDLPSRHLDYRAASRLSSNQISFQPYTYPQLQEIIRDRLRNSKAIDEKAIELAAKKVALITGDLRKVMDILRHAIDVAIGLSDLQLTHEHVLLAQREACSTLRVGLVSALSRHSLILFNAALVKVQSSGLDEFTFLDLYEQYCQLCTSLKGISPLLDCHAHQMLMRLCSNRLLIVQPCTNMLLRKVRLGMTIKEAQLAINVAEKEREAVE